MISIFVFYGSAFSQTKYEITPGISVSETYDDNIYLTNLNQISDYYTVLTPSIILEILSEKTSLDLNYAPSFVWYAQQDQNNSVRHSASLAFGQALQQYLRFDLTDSYLKSDDPIEDIDDPSGNRTTRKSYQRNIFNASLNYVFGAENALNVGYLQNRVENEEVTLDDSTIQTPFVSFTYWFNIKNGLEFNYAYQKANFSLDGVGIPRDDYEGHTPGIRYIHRFNPHTSGFIGINYTDRDFDGPTEDYQVNEALLGFEHIISPELSLSLGGGYFKQINEISPDQDGYLYNVSLVDTFERGTLTIGGTGGWDEDFLEATRRGFVKYYGANANIQYMLLQNLNGYAGGSYRHEKDQANLRRDIRRGNIGLSWSFLRWFALTLDYVYADRDDEIEIQSYTDNRITLRLTTSRLFQY
jgi:hypothetical protein